MRMIRAMNDGLAFLLELAMLGAFAYWGFHTGIDRPLRLVLGIGLPLGVAALWGVFLSPKARVPLARGLHLVVTTLLFALAAAALVAAGQWAFGAAIAVLYAVNRLVNLVR